jgi:uncharacterized protein (DUF488 family)
MKALHRPLKLPANPRRVRVENKALWNEARSPENADFYTIGYEGRTAKDLIELVHSVDANLVLDIRHTPISMYRPEFSKANFQKIVHDAGLGYAHLPQWGVPRSVRQEAANTGTRETIWEWYDRCVVQPHFGRNLHWFLNLDHPVVLMCVEHDPTECHRRRLFMALERQGLRGFDL